MNGSKERNKEEIDKGNGRYGTFGISIEATNLLLLSSKKPGEPSGTEELAKQLWDYTFLLSTRDCRLGKQAEEGASDLPRPRASDVYAFIGLIIVLFAEISCHLFLDNHRMHNFPRVQECIFLSSIYYSYIHIYTPTHLPGGYTRMASMQKTAGKD